MGQTIKKRLLRILPYFLIGLIVFLAVTFATECSFAFRMNVWNDVNCFYTVAYAMKNGAVLYRDIYEQKGLYLYVIHILAIYMAPAGSYIGMYFIELICGFIFAYFSYKTFRLFDFSKRKATLSTMAVVLFLYISFAFYLGDSAEELAVPMYAFSLYTLLKKAKKNEDIPYYSLVISGVLAGVLFLIKFTLISFYVGFGIIYFIWKIKDKEVGQAFIAAGFFIAGFILASVPCLIYFASNGALNDLWTVYFYDNIFFYSNRSNMNIFLQLLASLGTYFMHTGFGWPYFVSMIFALVYVIITKKIKGNRVFSGIIVTFASISLLMIIGRVHYSYYGIPFAIYGFTGILCLNDLSIKKEKIGAFLSKFKKPISAVSFALMAVISFAGAPDMPEVFKREEDLVPFRFKKIIMEEENPTILNYGFLDMGLYYICQVPPTCKYFTGLNSVDPKIEEGQQNSIDNGLTTFVVSVNKEPMNIYNHYELVSTEQYKIRLVDDTYYLYRLKGLH